MFVYLFPRSSKITWRIETNKYKYNVFGIKLKGLKGMYSIPNIYVTLILSTEKFH